MNPLGLNPFTPPQRINDRHRSIAVNLTHRTHAALAVLSRPPTGVNEHKLVLGEFFAHSFLLSWREIVECSNVCHFSKRDTLPEFS